MNKFSVVILACAGVLLAGCGSVTAVTKDRVARADSVVQQSQQTVGNAEAGAIDLQRSRELLESARAEMKNGNGPAAERLAQQAQLTADLAVAKTQNAEARKAADEMTASIEQLRQEANR